MPNQYSALPRLPDGVRNCDMTPHLDGQYAMAGSIQAELSALGINELDGITVDVLRSFVYRAVRALFESFPSTAREEHIIITDWHTRFHHIGEPALIDISYSLSREAAMPQNSTSGFMLNGVAETAPTFVIPPRRRRSSQLMLPTTPLDPRLRNVAMLEIRRNDFPVSLAPPNRLVQSIAALGVIQPVVLVEGNLEAATPARRLYTVAAGRRRILAAEELNLREIPAIVFPNGTPRNVAASMALSENFIRRASPVSETLEAARLLREGYTPEEICDALRLPPRTFRGRLRLATLPDEILRALSEGAITLRIARMIASLPAAARERVRAMCAAGDEITESFIRSIAPVEPTQGELLPPRIDESPHFLNVSGLHQHFVARLQSLADRARRGSYIQAFVEADELLRQGTAQQTAANDFIQRPAGRTFNTVPAGTTPSEARAEQRARRTPQQRQVASDLAGVVAELPRRWITVQSLLEASLSTMPDAALYTEAAQREIVGIGMDLNAIHDRVQAFVEAESTVA